MPHLLGRMTCSTPPALEFPLSFVKSSTWLTVSTSDVPQAWTVCRKDIWLWFSGVSASSSAAAKMPCSGVRSSCEMLRGAHGSFVHSFVHSFIHAFIHEHICARSDIMINKGRTLI